MVTGKEYAAKAMEVYKLKPQAGYIWGTGGVLWTEQRQKNLITKYNSDPERYSDLKLGALIGKKWIGHMVWDCSGLTSERAKKLGLSFHHGSNSSYLYDCAHKGKKTKGMKLPVGAWVYTGTASKKPHIGIVVDEENVLEAQGTKTGVVMSKISHTKWTYWGLGKGMEFDFVPSKENVSEPAQMYHPTIRRGAKGDFVKERAARWGGSGSLVHIKEVDVLLAGWKDNVQPLAGSTPVPRKFRR